VFTVMMIYILTVD